MACSADESNRAGYIGMRRYGSRRAGRCCRVGRHSADLNNRMIDARMKMPYARRTNRCGFSRDAMRVYVDAVRQREALYVVDAQELPMVSVDEMVGVAVLRAV